MSSDWQKAGTVIGICVALAAINGARHLSMPSLPSFGGSAVSIPSGPAGPRETQLNGIIADMQQRGLLGKAVLEDEQVRSVCENARAACRQRDTTYGITGVYGDPVASQALIDVNNAMRLALQRIQASGRFAQ